VNAVQEERQEKEDEAATPEEIAFMRSLYPEQRILAKKKIMVPILETEDLDKVQTDMIIMLVYKRIHNHIKVWNIEQHRPFISLKKLTHRVKKFHLERV